MPLQNFAADYVMERAAGHRCTALWGTRKALHQMSVIFFDPWFEAPHEHSA